MLSIKAAYPQIMESNKIYKNEAKEKVVMLEETIKQAVSNVNKVQVAHENMVSHIRKEFNDLFEELKRRELFLLESVSNMMETELTTLKGRIEDLEFLKSCFRDAREVDPLQSIELGVHFYAVYNLLRATIKPFEFSGVTYGLDDFNLLEFGTRNLVKSEIANFGKFFNNKSPAKKYQQKPTLTTKPRSDSVQKIAVERSLSPLKATATNIQMPKPRAITPERNIKVVVQQKAGKSPTTSYMERETIKKATKLKNSKSSGKLNTQSSEMLTFPRTEESIPTLFPTRETNTIETNESPKRVTISDFDNKVRRSESPDIIRKKPLKTAPTVVTEEDMIVRRSYEPHTQNINPIPVTKSVEMINNLFFFNESSILTSDLKNTEFYSFLPPNIKHTKLLYRMSEHGASSAAFHEKCDHQSNILLVAKADNKYVFGYYLPVNLVSEEKYSTCEDLFIFSLKNPLYERPMKFGIKPDKKFISIYQSGKSPCLGSTLQNKQDLWLQ
jgi:hypothetical protein